MQLVLEETVQAPLEVTFDVFSDLNNAAKNVESIESLEILGGGPVGKGTRFRETRIMFGKEATEEMEISAYDPPSSYTVTGYSCGVEFNTTYRFAEAGDATKVTMTMVSRNKSLFAKVIGPLMGAVMKKSMTKMMATDHGQLKAAAEARAGAGAGAS